MARRQQPGTRRIGRLLEVCTQSARVLLGCEDRPDGRSVPCWQPLSKLLLAGGVLIALAIATRVNYGPFRRNFLLIHTLAEMFSIVVAVCIFALAWNSRDRLDNSYLLVVGTAYFFVGCLDLTHTLAYKDMGVFASVTVDEPTQLWIAARYVEAISLFAAPLLLRRTVRARLLLAIYAAATAALLWSIFASDLFPRCFEPGRGLTTFKKISEYAISALLVASLVLLIHKRRWFEPSVLALMGGSAIITVGSEMAFTLYRDPYGPANLWGHVLKIVSFYLVYRAVVFRGLVRPHELIFRELKQHEEALQLARDELEQRVRQRVAELVEVNEQLTREAQARQEARETLALQHRRFVSLLHMLPGYVGLHGRDHRTRFANHKFLELFGEPGERLCYEVHGNRDSPCPACPLTDDDLPDQAGQWQWTSSAGRTYHVWAYPFTDIDGSRVALELGIDITERKVLERRVLEISEMEQRRIGQDLHDTLGQNLTGAAFLSKVLGEKLSRRQAPECDDAAAIEELLNQAVAQTRSIAKGLCPVEVSLGGLADALEELAAGVRRVFEIACTFEHDPIDLLPPAVTSHAYRIVQEAVNNAVKHANASAIAIRARRRDHAFELVVADDGDGMPPGRDPPKGMGLRIMQYRAGVIGATIDVSSAPGEGTTIRCRLPLPRPVHEGHSAP